MQLFSWCLLLCSGGVVAVLVRVVELAVVVEAAVVVVLVVEVEKVRVVVVPGIPFFSFYFLPTWRSMLQEPFGTST